MAPLKSTSRQKKAVQKAGLAPPPGKRSRQPKKAPVGAIISWPPDEDRVEEIFTRLSDVMPDPKTELDFVNPYTLVVAVALSAQATDVGVNRATKALFAIADTPQKMLALGEEGLIPLIASIGLYRTKAKNVIAAAPYVGEQAMLTREDNVRGVVLRGIVPSEEATVSDLGKQITEGTLANLTPGSFGIVLGRELARGLGVSIGDKITLVAPQGTITPAGVLPRVKQFTVVAIFTAGHYEYDSSLALIDLHDAETLYRLDGPTGVRLKIQDMEQAPLVARELIKLHNPDVLTLDVEMPDRKSVV